MSSGGIPLHESQEVYGVSEDCKFNDHTLCRSTRCGCSCHRAGRVATDNSGVGHIRADKAPNIAGVIAGLDKYCPKCKVKAGGDQNYCKIDGSKLSSLRCPECNTPGDESDNYCGYCGCGMKQIEIEAALGMDMAGEFDAPPGATITGIKLTAEAAMKAALKSTKVKSAEAYGEVLSDVVNISKLPPGVFK